MRPLPALLLAVLAWCGTAAAAHATCTDAASPGAQWRRCLLDGADLSGANLAGADLRDSSFKRADFSGARLVGVQAGRAKLVAAKLAGADLSGADLTQADLTTADLTGAIWTDGTTICAEGSIGRCHPTGQPAPANDDKVSG